MISSNTDFFPLTVAAQKVKQQFNLKRNPHPGSIRRWSEHGVSGVKLKTVFVAGELCTCSEWLMLFIEQSTDARNKRTSRKKTNTVQQQREAKQDREAKKLGIK